MGFNLSFFRMFLKIYVKSISTFMNKEGIDYKVIYLDCIYPNNKGLGTIVQILVTSKTPETLYSEVFYGQQ